MSGFTIADLRTTLADTIRDLRDPKSDMTVEKAKAINDLSQTIINSAKVEVDALKVMGGTRMKPTGFLLLEHEESPGDPKPPEPEPTSAKGRLGESPRGSLR